MVFSLNLVVYHANRRKIPGSKNQQTSDNSENPRPKEKNLLVLADYLVLQQSRNCYTLQISGLTMPLIQVWEVSRGQMKGRGGICKTSYLSERQTAGSFCGCCGKSSWIKPTLLIKRRSVISKESVSFTSDRSSCFSGKKSTWLFIRINTCT